MIPARPIIIIDSREQEPLPIEGAIRAGLYSGDYSIVGSEHSFAIERKSIADLVSSIIQDRDRFTNELLRLRGLQFKRLLIIGSESDITAHRYRSKANPVSVLHSLWAFECRYDVPVVFSPTPHDAAVLVERWATWFAYSISRQGQQLYSAQKKAAKGLTASR
jgi:ERCC4-type nuclease